MIGKWFKRSNPSSIQAVPVTWPSLPVTGFLAGRSATIADLDRGDAVFCQQAGDGPTSEPYQITIPQYAVWANEARASVPVIVVQAEYHITEPTGAPLLGLRALDGSEVVASASEVQLLGENIPV